MNKRLAIFASGAGTNAENLVLYFRHHEHISVPLILCNNSQAGVVERGLRLQVPVHLFTREELENGSVLKVLQENEIDHIVLAGFLWLLPGPLIAAYRHRIINIHPALLPKYGGKGMYGDRVHKAVVAAGEKETGITVHEVDERYDEGRIIFQARVPVQPADSPDAVAFKCHELEYRHLPEVVENWMLGKQQ